MSETLNVAVNPFGAISVPEPLNDAVNPSGAISVSEPLNVAVIPFGEISVPETLNVAVIPSRQGRYVCNPGICQSHLPHRGSTQEQGINATR